jgi:eukaryotic-like serine/threonine-protein kinase
VFNMQGGPSQLATGVHEGDVIAGKYRVDKILGQGGMGVVVAAHHMQLDTRVALKFLLPEALHNPEAVGRFVREARAAVRIMSEHVARVIDVGTLENGAPYMVMEYLEGGDLAGWLQQRGALPIEQAVEFVLQACVAVADAHALGIVHRDLKPANLFCVRRSDGQLSIKVLDFGISKLTDMTGTGPSPAMTKTSAMMGSPLYMSPEQMQSSKGVDARTDIWALGVVLFELIAGRPPFQADTLTELVIKIATEPPPPLRSFRPDVPAGLEAVVVKCLTKDVRQRYPNVGELAVALLPFAPKRAKGSVERISGILQSAGLSVSALALPSSSHADPTQVSSGTLLPVGRTTSGGTRGRSALIGVGLVGVIAIGAAATFALLSKKVPAHDEPQTAAAQPVVPTTSSPGMAPVDPQRPTPSTPTVAAPQVPSAASTGPAESLVVSSPATPASSSAERQSVRRPQTPSPSRASPSASASGPQSPPATPPAAAAAPPAASPPPARNPLNITPL